MATRWYLSKQAHTTINPGTKGTWASETSKQILNLETIRAATDTTFTTYSKPNIASISTYLMRQYISPGMAAGVVFNSSVTWTVCVRISESTSLGNIFLRLHGAIVSEDGLTERGYEWSFADSTEATVGTGTDQTAVEVSITGLGGSYTTVAGDRIVLEIGFNKTSTDTVTAYMQLGNADPTVDLSGAGDTDADNPWFEISVTAGTGTGGGGSPGSSTEDYSLEGYITGVLDDWA